MKTTLTPLCQQVVRFLGTGRGAGQDRPGPGNSLLAPASCCFPPTSTHTYGRTPGLAWRSPWRAKYNLFQSPTIYLFSKFHSTSLQSPIPPSWLEEVALSLWSLDPPELLCRLQVQDLEMSSEWQYRALRFTASVSLPGILYCLPGTRKTPRLSLEGLPCPGFGSLSHITNLPPISELQLLAGHLCLDVLASTRNSAAWVSITSLQNTHFRFLQLPTTAAQRPWRVINFPQRINFHSSPSFTLPVNRLFQQ